MVKCANPGLALLLLVGWAESAEAAAGQGATSCPCINPYTHPSLQGAGGLDPYRSGNQLLYTPAGSSQHYTYPPGYGNGCQAHDVVLRPTCSETSVPAWCEVEWCYVDHTNCLDMVNLRSKYWPDAPLYFSYATCRGAGGSGNAPSPSGSWGDSLEVTRKLFSLADSYVSSARILLEEAYRTRNFTAICLLNADNNMCPCNSCVSAPLWGSEADFSETGTLQGRGGTDADRNAAVCMGNRIQTNYKSIAARESDSDYTKVGYLYFGDVKTGSITQWPKEAACDWGGSVPGAPYDPRYRDWFVAGATGPKDLIIVVDVSGSMSSNGRHAKAREATKRIIDTLTWKDYASIVLFNNAVSAVYSTEMVAATERTKADMKEWCDRQTWQSGGTSFVTAFVRAFKIIADSVYIGKTSMCQKAVTFLTDGEATFTEANYAFVKSQGTKYDTVIFTYALGSGAQADVMKRIACENRGVFYPISDDQNLADVMALYFDYFAQGQEICTSSFVRYTTTSGVPVFSDCMPMYDRTQPQRSFMGVSCMDVSLIENVAEMQTQSGWSHFVCQASDVTKMCRPVELSDCHRQRVRQAYSDESVCENGDFRDIAQNSTCPCQDPSCQDDPDWQDEYHYYCDTWVGDDCVNVDPEWGYSQAGVLGIQTNCKRSCGLCEWMHPCPLQDSGECNVVPVATECRACLGRTTGVDIEDNPMDCPPDSPRDLMAEFRKTANAEAASLSLQINVQLNILVAVLALHVLLRPWHLQMN